MRLRYVYFRAFNRNYEESNGVEKRTSKHVTNKLDTKADEDPQERRKLHSQVDKQRQKTRLDEKKLR